LFKKFCTRKDEMKWVRDQEIRLSPVTVVTSSDHGVDIRTITLVLGCERGAKCKEYKVVIEMHRNWI